MSYAHADDTGDQVQNLVSGLSGLEPFIDLTEIRTGEDLERKINDGLTNSVSFLAFVSPEYLKSKWCRLEWQAWSQQLGLYRLQTDARRIILLSKIPGLSRDSDPGTVALRFAEEHPADFDVESLDIATDILREVQKNLYVLPEDALALEKLHEDLALDGQQLRTIEASPETIPPYNWNFVGRRDEMNRLRVLLGENNRTGVIYGIHGLGGMGKTELAIAYAHRFAKHYPAGRFWIRCNERMSLRDALLSESSFTIQFWDRITGEQRMQPEIYYEAIKRAMKDVILEHGPMLLVLDNVVHAQMVSYEQVDGLGAFSGRLHLLATTRNPPTGTQWLSLDRLPEPDALALLERYRPFESSEDKSSAERLVRKLGGFTLAVELVGAWAAVHQTDFSRLCERIDLSHLDYLGDDTDVELRRHNDEKRLSAILSPVLRQLDPISLRVLRYAAFLPADQVSLPWIQELVRLEPRENASDLLDPFGEALLILRRWSLFRISNVDHRIVHVHRLIQELVINHIQGTEGQTIVTQVEVLVRSRAQLILDEQNWTRNGWELGPLEALAWQWIETGHTNSVSFQINVGAGLSDASQWSRAESLLRRALQIAERAGGSEHSGLPAALNNLASLLQTTGRYDEAEPLYRRALEIDERILGPDNQYLAIRLNNLAELLRETSRLSEAKPLYRRALKIDHRAVGPNDAIVARRLSNLALLFQSENRLLRAECLLRRALKINLDRLGRHHSRVAVTQSNLANLLLDAGQFPEAELLLRSALHSDEINFGVHDYRVAIRLNGLAELLRRTSQPEEAEPLLRRALKILLELERCHGHRPPQMLKVAENYAELLTGVGFEIPDVAAVVMLIAPELFAAPLPYETVATRLRERIAAARSDRKVFVADTLQDILDTEVSHASSGGEA